MNDVLKKTLRHYIDLEYYANGIWADIEEALYELYAKCGDAILENEYLNTKAAYNAVSSVLEDYLSEFSDLLKTTLEKEAEIVIEKERSFLSKLYGAVLTVGAVKLSKVLFIPFDNKDTVKTFAERTVKNIRRNYDSALRSGYTFGQKSSDIKGIAEKNLKNVTNGVHNGVITAIPSFAKQTDRIIFLNNNKEVVHCAVLDGKTCIVCGNLHGKHYPSITVAPPLPVHDLCRCFYILASLITEPMPTYQEYIDGLPDGEQYHILGKNRYELHKKGLSLERFVNNGKKLRLDQIDIPE